MDTKVNARYSPNFGKFMVKKRAQAAFELFKINNAKGPKSHEDIFEAILKETIKAQDENPVAIIIDFFKFGKKQQKKLGFALFKQGKRLTSPIPLKIGFDKSPYTMMFANNTHECTKGTPKYLQQLIKVGEIADKFKELLSKKTF